MHWLVGSLEGGQAGRQVGARWRCCRLAVGGGASIDGRVLLWGRVTITIRISRMSEQERA